MPIDRSPHPKFRPLPTRPGSAPSTVRRAAGWSRPWLTTAALWLALPLLALAVLAVPAGPAAAQTPQQSRLHASGDNHPRAMAQRALQQGDATRALAIADQALTTYPNDARLRFTRAMALNELNRLAESEEAFLSLTMEFPELPEPYNNLAVVRAAQGKLDQARVALEDAIRAVPGYAPAHQNLADIYLQLALRNLGEASRLEPDNSALAARVKALTPLAAPSGGDRPASRPSAGR